MKKLIGLLLALTATVALAADVPTSIRLGINVLGGTSGNFLQVDSHGKLTQAPGASSSVTSLTGDVTGTGPGATATTVALVGGSTAANVHTSQLATAAATAANTASTLVKRDASGHAALGVLERGSVSVSDLPTGGSIGSAASTVDVAEVALVNQTTAAQTVTIPSPTSAGPIRKMIVANVGSTSFTFLGATVATSTFKTALWTGSAWILGS